MRDDQQLLKCYADEGSEDAFSELVARYVNLLYSAALRRTGGDLELAKEVAQLVFTDLARKARSLPEGVLLAGWLHRANRFAAAQLLRADRRRRAREQEAATMNTLGSEPPTDWDHILPLLDDALDRLGRRDREALLLRFFEQRSLAEIAAALGSSEEAARKRVHRALETVRADLVRRGLATTSSALASALSANAVHVAPTGLGASLTTAALTGKAAGTGTILAIMRLMSVTKLQAGVLGALLALGLCLVFYFQHGVRATLLGENAYLRQKLAQLEQQGEPPTGLVIGPGEWQRLRGAQAEVLRLRGEVALLTRQEHRPWFPTNQVSESGGKETPKTYISGFERLQFRGRAQLAEGQTLAFGGWAADPGYRLLFLATPKIAGENPEQVFIDVVNIEAPEALLNRFGMGKLSAPAGVQGRQAVISGEQKSGFWAGLDQDGGGSYRYGLSPLITSNGVPLSVRSLVVDHGALSVVGGPEEKLALNEPYILGYYDLGAYLGPPLIMVPTIMGDKRSIDLTVDAAMFWRPGGDQ